MSQVLFYASYLYVPFVALTVFALVKSKGLVRALALIALVISSVLAYARFVEPRILQVNHETIMLQGATAQSPSLRLALFSDTHFGVFKNAMPMSRIVDKVNAQSPDAVLIAGDFLYNLAPAEIPAALAPLANIDVPVYAVLGNHDVGRPGRIYTAELYSALKALDVTLVENRAYEAVIAGQEVIIGGTSDLWERRQHFDFTIDLPDKPLLLLTHNPDTAMAIPADVDVSLVLAGHTHGGQVRIPGLVGKVIPTRHPFDKGLHIPDTPGGKRLVYVTTGTGMVGLPLRFNMPPRIDILTVHIPAQP